MESEHTVDICAECGSREPTASFNNGKIGDALFIERASGDDPGDATTEDQHAHAGVAFGPLVRQG